MKPWYKSKTIWFNAGLAAVGALVAAVPTALAYFPVEWTGLFILGTAAVGAFLRVVTEESVGL